MPRKSIISGLVLLITGAVILTWSLAERKKITASQRQRQEQIDNKLAELNKVLAGEIDLSSLEGDGEDYSLEPLDVRKQRERIESKLIVSSTITAGGAFVFMYGVILWTARLIIKSATRLRAFVSNVFRRYVVNKIKLMRKKCSKRKAERLKAKRQQANRKDEAEQSTVEEQDSGCEAAGSSCEYRQQQVTKKTVYASESGGDSHDEAEADGAVGVLVAEKKAFEIVQPAEDEAPEFDDDPVMDDCSETETEQASLDSDTDTRKLENILKEQTDSLGKQLEEFKRMTCTVQKSTIEHSEPLKNGLKDLFEQVSAIREYASKQQNRIEKLQEGYDWNIIRNFCLRIIRCIDNINERIRKLSEKNQGADTTALEEVRDELVFALESSGVEQYEPAVNKDYSGQEKTAEAVRKKQHTKDEQLKGKVARVLRPGYRYFIDENNSRVVRPAQVMLYG